MFSIAPPQMMEEWYDDSLDNFGAIKTVQECRSITEPLLQHVVAILTTHLGVSSAHPGTICESLWRPPLCMDYVQYADIIQRAGAMKEFVDAYVMSMIGDYFMEDRRRAVLDHVDVERVASSTQYIEWFKTEAIKMVTDDAEPARNLRSRLFKTTHALIMEQAQGHPDIFDKSKTLSMGDIVINFKDISIGELGAAPSSVQENTVKRILRVVQMTQTDENAGVMALRVFNRMSQEVRSFEVFEANARFIAGKFPGTLEIVGGDIQFAQAMLRLPDVSQKRKAEDQVDVIEILDNEDEEDLQPEQAEEQPPESISILDVHQAFRETLKQVFDTSKAIQAPELAQDPILAEFKQIRRSVRLDLCVDLASHASRMESMRDQLRQGPLVLLFSILNKTIGLKGQITEKNSGLHDAIPRKLSDAFGNAPKSLSKPGFIGGAWSYTVKYKYNLYAIEAYMKVVAYINRQYAGKTISAETPTLDKTVGTLNWDVRFQPQPWLSAAAVAIGFDHFITEPSKNNPIRAGTSTFQFKRCGMTQSGTIAAIKHLQEKTGGYANVVTTQRFSDLLDVPTLTCMPVAWAKHARLAYKATDEKTIYFIDPWKQKIQIPREYVEAARSRGYEVKFVKRTAEQFRGEGSCSFVAFMRMIMYSRTGKAGLTADIDNDYAVLAYHLLSKFKQVKACKKQRAL